MKSACDPLVLKNASLIVGQACGKAMIEMQSSPTSSVNFFIFFFLGDSMCYREISLRYSGEEILINLEDIRKTNYNLGDIVSRHVFST